MIDAYRTLDNSKDQRRLEREKKDKQEKDRKERAVQIAKQIAKDNPEWTYSPDSEHNSDWNYLTHKKGARISIGCVYPYRKILATYSTKGQDFSGGPALEFGVDGDRDVMDGAKSPAKRILPAALEKYARHLEKKAEADRANNEFRSFLERMAKLCEAKIDPESLRRYVENRRATLDFIPCDFDDPKHIKAEIELSQKRWNKITINYLSPEEAEAVIYAIRETLNK